LYRDSDPQFNKKKRHIGNDFVAIVYNESGLPYTMGTVKVAYLSISFY
jgi:tuberous sclerosis protein 2